MDLLSPRGALRKVLERETRFVYDTLTSPKKSNLFDEKLPQNSPKTLYYGNSVKLRNVHGKSYLRIVSKGEFKVNGNGVNCSLDQEFIFVNTKLRQDVGKIHYGDIVAIQIKFDERNFFVSNGGKIETQVVPQVGPVISMKDRWMIVKAGSEDALALGEVNTGDEIALRTMDTAEKYLISKGVAAQVCDGNDLTSIGMESWEISLLSVPYQPAWSRNGAFAVPRYDLDSYDEYEYSVVDSKIGSLPDACQEEYMVREILFALLGFQGGFVKMQREKEGAVFTIKGGGSLNGSVVALANKVLPICGNYVNVANFVERKTAFEQGQVAHAFVAAIREKLKEYAVVVAQLEGYVRDGTLTLQKLWFLIQPSMQSMQLLQSMSKRCEHVYGGALLCEIGKISNAHGDPEAVQLFQEILEKAAAPYMRMLSKWLYTGEMEDPFHEFMILEDTTLKKEELLTDPWSTYWEKRYTLHDEDKIPFFSKDCVQNILKTGRYLSVVRACNHDLSMLAKESILYDHNPRNYEVIVHHAYEHASKLVLHLLLTECKLMERLQSVKHYFLMDQGDFFIEFCDIAAKELNTSASKVSCSRLEALLQLALQTCTCLHDPYKDDLTCKLSTHNLIYEMELIHKRSDKSIHDPLTYDDDTTLSHFSDDSYKAIDALTLDYNISWPLSLVVSAGALNKYQMIFRHLFLCKHVEKRLCDAWRDQQATKEYTVRAALSSSYCLRQRMLHFQQNFGYFMMIEVVAPRWHEFEDRMKKVSSVDEILLHHQDFLDNCLKECLLTDPELLRVLTKLMNVCLSFATCIETYLQPFQSNPVKTKTTPDQRKNLFDTFSKSMVQSLLSNDPENNTTSFTTLIQDFEKQFDTLLADFLEKLLYQSHLQVCIVFMKNLLIVIV